MTPTPSGSGRSGMRAYLKAAFTYHWNLLLFVGGAALAALSGQADALLPVVGALELAYLSGMMAMPRFRTAVDAQTAKRERERATGARVGPGAQESLERMVNSLPAISVKRFASLRTRCFEMRDIASGVRGQAAGSNDSADSIRTPALDRLLFLFLKLLMSQAGLDRFMRSTSEPVLTAKVDDVRKRLTAAQASKDERMIGSLQDSLADAELRLDNYKKSQKDADFVAIELDRIEMKIQALTEMGVSSQDPDTLSHQVTAAAESMQRTESTVNQLQHLTGLADQLEEPPAILDAHLDSVLRVR